MQSLEHGTLSQALDVAFREYPERRVHFPVLNRSLSYAELREATRNAAAGLRARGVGPGSLVGLLFASSPEFIACFAGVLAAGGAAIPLPHPGGARAFSAYVQRLRSILESSGVRIVLTGDEFAGHVEPMLNQARSSAITAIRADQLLLEGAQSASPEPTARPEDIALVQYTSGSTTEPKGVVLTHGNLLAGIRAIVRGIELDHRDVNAQWLPLHHDMGLIGMLAGLCCGVEHYLWSPIAFIRHPGRWLSEFARVGASIYAGPNFSYASLLRKLPEDAVKALDLSRWRIAFNGAEVIDPVTVERFIERFRPAGFRAETMFPVYGLAEATLAVSFPRLGSRPRTLWVDRDVLANDARVVDLGAPGERARGLLAVGSAVREHAVRIVSAAREPLSPGQSGEIEIRGPAVMRSYLGMSPEESGVSADGWAKTGDLGFLHDGELYVAGRTKEMIIVRGAKYYPFDVEAIARPIDGLYRDHVVAFAYADQLGERIVVVAETDDGGSAADLAKRIEEATLSELGLAALEVILVRPRTLTRTTSGKFQRLQTRDRLRAGELSAQQWR